MKRLWVSLAILALLLTACKPASGSADLLDSGRRHIEASRCAGVDRYATAIADLEQAISANPDLAEAHYWLVIAHVESGDAVRAADALTGLETLIETDGQNLAARYWLLAAHYRQGAPARAAALLSGLEATAEAHPGDGEALYWLGRARYVLNDVAGAEQALQSAVTLAPDHALAHFWLGQVYHDQGQLDQAWEQFDVALQHDPDNAAAYHNRGVVAYQIGQLQQALADLQAAHERDPDDPHTHYQLGAIQLVLSIPELGIGAPDTRLLDAAQARFESALELCPGMIEPLIGLGNLHLIRGDVASSIDALEQALATRPESPEALFGLVRVYVVTEQIDLACQSIDRFLDTDLSPEWQIEGARIRAQLACP